MADRPPRLTVGELTRMLSSYPDHYEVEFSGLDFYRLKQRDETLVQVEFNQQVYRTPEGQVVVQNLD